MSYFSLFLSALLSATLLPGSSEILFGVLVNQGYLGGLLWLSATLGNVLGSAVNYVLGAQLQRFKHAKWFPVSETQLVKAEQQFQRFGKWSLLFAWLPIIGDPLTLFAGVMRLPFWWFIVLVTVGKGIRYALVLWFALHVAT
ncbi:YqaA family protein [Pseudoalteromonas xiamenensis]